MYIYIYVCIYIYSGVYIYLKKHLDWQSGIDRKSPSTRTPTVLLSCADAIWMVTLDLVHLLRGEPKLCEGAYERTLLRRTAFLVVFVA